MNGAVCRAPRADDPPWHGRPARLVAVEQEGPGVATYRFAVAEPPAFAAGQFNMLHLPGIGAAAISISTDPGVAATVGHTIRAVGNVTHAIARLRLGAGILLRGPFGTPWPLDALRGRDVVVAAGGVGMASLRTAVIAMARHRRDYGRITLLQGSGTPAALLYAREHAAWRRDGIDVRTIVDRVAAGWTAPVGIITDLVAGLDLAAPRTSLLCCGPEPMMKAVVAAFQARGLASADMFLALERNMACAAGVCGLCQFGPAFVCRDGPVFRHDRIAPFLAVANL